MASSVIVSSYAEELALYRAHHSHMGNWLLHAACVPLEWLSFLITLALVEPRLPWAVQGALAALVLACNRPALVSVCISLGLLVLAQAANWVVIDLVPGRRIHAIALAAGSCSLSWAVQVPIGHWLLERNQPSMASRLTINSVLLSVPLAWDRGLLLDSQLERKIK
mmetsp:Transcript_10269/g.26704  ORF Transcript_10269/g.26704 Transcript_10269/m.26704 type:complete len:166 (+) Transcript_10269:3-500(+)